MGILANVPSTLNIPGSYVAEPTPQPTIQVGLQTNTLAISGVGSYGPVGVLTNVSGTADGQLAVGKDTLHPNSILSEIQSAQPECTSFAVVRVTDGTDVAALISVADVSAANFGSFTLAETGSDGDAASSRFDLISGTLSSNPVVRLTLVPPLGKQAYVYNLPAYAAANGAFSATTLQTNINNAVNVSTPGSPANPDFIWSAGIGTHCPVLATAVAATGGTDGATTITDSVLLGQDLAPGATGIFAMRKKIKGAILILAGCSDPTVYGTLTGFCAQEQCMAGISLGTSGTTTVQAVTQLASNSIANRYVMTAIDWEVVDDTFAQEQRTVSPLGGIFGAIASLRGDQPPLNKPYGGKKNMIGTERTVAGAEEILDGEAGLRTANHILWLSNQYPRSGSGFLIAGMRASDGTPIADTRMLIEIGFNLEAIGADYVGEDQTTLDNDETRQEFQDRCNSYLKSLMPTKGVQRIQAGKTTCDLTTETALQVQDGYMIGRTNVTTKSGIEYVLNILQVGNTIVVQ